MNTKDSRQLSIAETCSPIVDNAPDAAMNARQLPTATSCICLRIRSASTRRSSGSYKFLYQNLLTQENKSIERERERERESQNLLETIEIEGEELGEVRLMSGGGGGGGSEGERDEARQRRRRRFLWCIFRVHFQGRSAPIDEL